MYGWAGLHDWGQSLWQKCQKDWPAILGLEIRKDGSICLLRVERGEPWLVTDAVLLPAEPLELSEQAERISARLAREGWEDIPRVLWADEEQVLVRLIKIPPDMKPKEQFEAAYWEFESQLGNEGLAIEDFQVACMDLNEQQEVWMAAVSHEYIAQAEAAFSQAEIPLAELVTGDPLTSQVEFDPSDGGGLIIGDTRLGYGQSAAGLPVDALGGALRAALIFGQGIEQAAKRALWLLEPDSRVDRWDYQHLAMIMLAVVFSVASMLLAWDGWQLYQAQQHAVQSRQELQSLLPVQQKMQGEEKIRAGLEQKEQCLQSLSQTRFPWYSLLVHLGTMTVDGVWLDGLELQEQDEIRIEGQAVSYDAIADFVQAFEKDKDFFSAGPVLESSGSAAGKEKQAAGNSAIGFRMRLHL
ncbi:Tfp pilus assembly protein PilN [Selenomonas sp. GACV-9]|uniref:PilN domain-containing protein n=1 Tax=Selenomonas sp. GACV-9 TaxID=3158782 RepID=UPI0008F068A5|nr:Tfp pilus assembly protein PilN [Selenomonas ruminantium]